MGNVLSNAIEVFPTSKRGNYQRSARLITESNLIKIINELVDSDAFVITQNVNGAVTTTDKFELNLHGYYFNISTANAIISSVESSATSIYANIIVDTTDGYTELYGQDDGATQSKYEGIKFTANSADTSTLPSQTAVRYSLKILEKVNTSWVIPSSSIVKFNADRLIGNSPNIDGGEV